MDWLIMQALLTFCYKQSEGSLSSIHSRSSHYQEVLASCNARWWKYQTFALISLLVYSSISITRDSSNSETYSRITALVNSWSPSVKNDKFMQRASRIVWVFRSVLNVIMRLTSCVYSYHTSDPLVCLSILCRFVNCTKSAWQGDAQQMLTFENDNHYHFRLTARASRSLVACWSAWHGATSTNLSHQSERSERA